MQAQVEELEGWKQKSQEKLVRIKKKLYDEQTEKDTVTRQNRRQDRELERLKKNLEAEENTVAELQKDKRKLKADMDRIKREHEDEMLKLQVEIRRLKLGKREK